MSTAEATLSEIIAEKIRNCKNTITLDELESWSNDKRSSLPSRMVKKVWITVKMFIIKLRKIIFGF